MNENPLMKHTNPDLCCWKCGQPCWAGHPFEHRGNILVITVCPYCWEKQDFVNGKPARIILQPVGETRAHDGGDTYTEHRCVFCGKVHINCCGKCGEYPKWLAARLADQGGEKVVEGEAVVLAPAGEESCTG